MIQLDGVTKVFEGAERPALHDVSLSVAPGDFVFLCGPSGAGKSTLMKLLYRETLPTRGRVYVDGDDVVRMPRRRLPYLRRKIGIVFQDFRLLESKTVYENIAFVMHAVEADPRRIKSRVVEVLRMVGLPHKLRSYPQQLSGGEQQRVALARAIVNSPRVLLADEPTGNLDPETSWQIMGILEDIQLRGTALVVATHDMGMVNSMGRRVVTLSQGRIVRDQERGLYVHEA